MSRILRRLPSSSVNPTLKLKMKLPARRIRYGETARQLAVTHAIGRHELRDMRRGNLTPSFRVIEDAERTPEAIIRRMTSSDLVPFRLSASAWTLRTPQSAMATPRPWSADGSTDPRPNEQKPSASTMWDGRKLVGKMSKISAKPLNFGG